MGKGGGKGDGDRKIENKRKEDFTCFEYIKLYLYRFCTEKFKLQNKTKSTPSSICL